MSGTVNTAYGQATVGDTVTRAFGPLAYVVWGKIIRIRAHAGAHIKWDDGDETYVANPRGLDTL